MDFKILPDLDEEYLNKNYVLLKSIAKENGFEIVDADSNRNNTECIVISDAENAGEKWNGFVVIGIEHEKNIYGVSYVVESVKDIDAELIYMAYCRKNNIPVKICETEHLIIREMSASDINGLIRLYEMTDCRYIKQLGENEKTQEFVEKYIRNMYEFYGFGLWLACDRKNGEIVGRCGVEICEIEGESCYEIAYMIRGDYQGRGLGLELAKAVIGQAQKRDIQRIIARINEKNIPSINLIRKINFTFRKEIMDGNEKILIYEN